MEKERIGEIWGAWEKCLYLAEMARPTEDAKASIASCRDVLEIIRLYIEELVVNDCLKEPLLDPDLVLQTVLYEHGIPEEEFRRIK
jgi:hypothetical protein